MNNENINPNYKGRFLKNIVADYSLERLDFDEGTILIQDVGEVRVFFQLKSDYTYYNVWGGGPSLKYPSRKNKPMEIMSGSVIDSSGQTISDSWRFCLAEHVKVPADDELEWYERQNVI